MNYILIYITKEKNLERFFSLYFSLTSKILQCVYVKLHSALQVASLILVNNVVLS